MDRGNHYEAAFEAYLHWQRLCYVAVDETRRTLLDSGPIKSIDFIVHGDGGSRLLVDVKGRRFPGGPPERPRRVWECWCGNEDVTGLEEWVTRFGIGYIGLLVFTYQLQPGVELPDDTEDLFTWRGKRYLFRAVSVDEYHRHMKVRSPKWDTVDLPRAIYRRLARPLQHFTHGAPVTSEEDCPF
ncbi:MAG: HYExAFE family protein [Gemmataceae bacterium]|nr:HYExAFE family protein [Gemmataceae bacterium]